MSAPIRSLVPAEPFHAEPIAPGVTLRRLFPGGMAGPERIVLSEIPGGQTWSEAVALGGPDDDFTLMLPDIRMPANQFWPMHWHDCWTVVVVIEGHCLVGDWYMGPGDVFVAAPSIEYGPLVVGPAGCRLFEIFGDVALSPGGYSPEYRDHPTLQWGNHVFKPREGVNRRNEGRSSLPLGGAEGLWKTRLAPDWRWDLGEADDPNRGGVGYRQLAAGTPLPARSPGDWYGAVVLEGSIEVGGKLLARDDVLVVEPNASVPAGTVGADGAHLLEVFRTARAF